MPDVLPILFGWLFTIASCYAAGAIALRISQVTLYREEEHFFRFIIGAGCFSLLVFALTAAHLAYEAVFLVTGAAIMALAFRITRGNRTGVPLPDYPILWKTVFLGAIMAFGVYYFIHALAPETSPDGATYHLGIVGRYLRQHSFGAITTQMYANLSEGIEMLFLPAYSIGRHSSAALVEFTFLLALPVGMMNYARRIGFPRAGVFGALAAYTSPVFGMSGTVAYNDAAGAAILFAMFYLLQMWSESRQPRLVPLIGLAAGFCYSAKYTLFLALPFAGLYLLWKLIRARAAFVRPLLVYSAFALLLVVPWMAKNWFIVGNPLSPFANRLFPNQFITIHFEDEYRAMMRQHPGMTASQRLMDNLVHGSQTSGLLGPVFLLTPLSLLALRYQAGRRLLLAAVVFVLPAFTNIETRFLMPMVPFAALALGLAIAPIPWAIPVVLAFTLFTAWPHHVRRYSGPNTWSLDGFHPAEAFRLIPEKITLKKRMPAIAIADLLEQKTPPGSRIFSFGNPPEAYTSREILVKYESALGNYLGELLWTPLVPDYQPSQSMRFAFPANDFRAMRLVQTAPRPPSEWSISEVHFFDGSTEIRFAKPWKLRASVNPWSIARAFDGNPVTRWSPMEPALAGMYLEVDFGQWEEISAVEVRSPAGNGIELRLEAMRGNREWKQLDYTISLRDPPLADLRADATTELKRQGVQYVLVGPDDFGHEDYFNNQKAWNMQLIGEAQGNRLYRLL